MRKLAWAALFSLFLIFTISNVKADEIPPGTFLFYDLFSNRTTISPWKGAWVAPCTLTNNYADIYNNEWLKFHYQAGCAAMAYTDIGTYASDFDLEIYDWRSTTNYDVMVLEWSDGMGNIVTIRWNKYSHSIEIGSNPLVNDLECGIDCFPWASRYFNTQYNYTHDYHGWWITKRGSTITIESDWVDDYVNLTITDARNDVPIRTILLATYNAVWTSTSQLDAIAVSAVGTVKILPTLVLNVTPYTTVYGNPQTASCHAVKNGQEISLPLTLSYFNTPVPNPYTNTFPIGTNIFYCDSNETDNYYPAHGVFVSYVTAANVTEAPAPIENVSQPSFGINETEWRQAGYGWVLIFFSPIFAITIVALLTSAGIARLSKSPQLGIVAFIFLVLFFILFTGIYPRWIILILIVISAALFAKYGGEILGGG